MHELFIQTNRCRSDDYAQKMHVAFRALPTLSRSNYTRTTIGKTILCTESSRAPHQLACRTRASSRRRSGGESASRDRTHNTTRTDCGRLASLATQVASYLARCFLRYEAAQQMNRRMMCRNMMNYDEDERSWACEMRKLITELIGAWRSEERCLRQRPVIGWTSEKAGCHSRCTTKPSWY